MVLVLKTKVLKKYRGFESYLIRKKFYKIMYLNIVFLPLFGSALSGLFGRYLGPWGSGIITTSCVVTSLCISFFAFYEVGFLASPCYIKFLPWFNI